MADPGTRPELVTIDQLAERLGPSTRHIAEPGIP